MSSVLSTPSQVFRQKPNLIRALAAFQRRKWWPEVESNHRHEDFQSSALPTELSGHFKRFPCFCNWCSLSRRSLNPSQPLSSSWIFGFQRNIKDVCVRPRGAQLEAATSTARESSFSQTRISSKIIKDRKVIAHKASLLASQKNKAPGSSYTGQHLLACNRLTTSRRCATTSRWYASTLFCHAQANISRSRHNPSRAVSIIKRKLSFNKLRPKYA